MPIVPEYQPQSPSMMRMHSPRYGSVQRQRERSIDSRFTISSSPSTPRRSASATRPRPIITSERCESAGRRRPFESGRSASPSAHDMLRTLTGLRQKQNNAPSPSGRHKQRASSLGRASAQGRPISRQRSASPMNRDFSRTSPLYRSFSPSRGTSFDEAESEREAYKPFPVSFSPKKLPSRAARSSYKKKTNVASPMGKGTVEGSSVDIMKQFHGLAKREDERDIRLDQEKVDAPFMVLPKSGSWGMSHKVNKVVVNQTAPLSPGGPISAHKNFLRAFRSPSPINQDPRGNQTNSVSVPSKNEVDEDDQDIRQTDTEMRNHVFSETEEEQNETSDDALSHKSDDIVDSKVLCGCKGEMPTANEPKEPIEEALLAESDADMMANVGQSLENYEAMESMADEPEPDMDVVLAVEEENEKLENTHQECIASLEQEKAESTQEPEIGSTESSANSEVVNKCKADFDDTCGQQKKRVTFSFDNEQTEIVDSPSESTEKEQGKNIGLSEDMAQISYESQESEADVLTVNDGKMNSTVELKEKATAQNVETEEKICVTQGDEPANVDKPDLSDSESNIPLAVDDTPMTMSSQPIERTDENHAKESSVSEQAHDKDISQSDSDVNEKDDSGDGERTQVLQSNDVPDRESGDGEADSEQLHIPRNVTKDAEMEENGSHSVVDPENYSKSNDSPNNIEADSALETPIVEDDIAQSVKKEEERSIDCDINNMDNDDEEKLEESTTDIESVDLSCDSFKISSSSKCSHDEKLDLVGIIEIMSSESSTKTSVAETQDADRGMTLDVSKSYETRVADLSVQDRDEATCSIEKSTESKQSSETVEPSPSMFNEEVSLRESTLMMENFKLVISQQAAKTKMSFLEEEVVEVRKQLSEEQDKAKEIIQRESQLAVKNSQLINKNEESHRIISDLENKVGEVKGMLVVEKDRNEELSFAKQELTEKCDELEKENDQSSKLVNSLKTKISRIKEELSLEQEKNRVTHAALESVQGKVGEMRKKHQDCLGKMSVLRDELTQSQDETLFLKEKDVVFVEKLKQAAIQQDKLKAQIDVLKLEKSNANNNAREAEKEIAILKETIKSIQAESDQNEKNMIEQKGVIQSLQTQLEEIQKVVKALQDSAKHDTEISAAEFSAYRRKASRVGWVLFFSIFIPYSGLFATTLTTFQVVAEKLSSHPLPEWVMQLMGIEVFIEDEDEIPNEIPAIPQDQPSSSSSSYFSFLLSTQETPVAPAAKSITNSLFTSSNTVDEPEITFMDKVAGTTQLLIHTIIFCGAVFVFLWLIFSKPQKDSKKVKFVEDKVEEEKKEE